MAAASHSPRMIRLFGFGALALALAGCADDMVGKEQAREMSQASPEVLARVARLQPGVIAWYRAAEQAGLSRGRPLAADETALARTVGVAEPGRVRIVYGFDYPAPDEHLSSESSTFVGVSRKPPLASTFGRAIYVDRTFIHNRQLLAHELTHVAQFERLGMEGFVHAYLLEMILFGHVSSPMEREASRNESLGN